MVFRLPARRLGAVARSTTRLRERPQVSIRSFITTPRKDKDIAGDNAKLPNMRFAQRPEQGELRAPIVNPADKYAGKAEALHTYGQYLMSCLPKYIQQ